MTETTHPAQPTATSLKNELRESLEVLKKDFESLDRFVAKLGTDGSSSQISLTNDDLHDLLTVAQEIEDAANNIEYEASKIREKLNRFIS